MYKVYNLAWSEHFTLEQFLREVEAALGIEHQQFHADDDAGTIYLYPTVCHSSTRHVLVLNNTVNKQACYTTEA